MSRASSYARQFVGRGKSPRPTGYVVCLPRSLSSSVSSAVTPLDRGYLDGDYEYPSALCLRRAYKSPNDGRRGAQAYGEGCTDLHQVAPIGSRVYLIVPLYIPLRAPLAAHLRSSCSRV